MSEPSRSPVALFFGWLLIVVGVLIAGLAGLCTLVFAPMMVSGGGGMEGLGLALLLGGAPIGLGAGMIIGGLAVIRKPKQQPPSAP
jgi:hypothetical protein